MRFQKAIVAIELRVVQFWSEIILVISNRTRAARSFDFEITRMISNHIALHSAQLPLLIVCIRFSFVRNKLNFGSTDYSACVVYTKTNIHLSVGESGRYLPPLR